jgi:hypothetical protein
MLLISPEFVVCLFNYVPYELTSSWIHNVETDTTYEQNRNRFRNFVLYDLFTTLRANAPVNACIFKRRATLMSTWNVNLIQLTSCTEWQESIIASNWGKRGLPTLVVSVTYVMIVDICNEGVLQPRAV